ncbi:dolichol-phosphate hexosyltransferase [Methylomarinovum caldicuralii]|uniref:Dolichol-phosphate hexosyltransferase n=1 Tax=Methylomarinovum caldicuralii TaxID=438856 RepID=A0AAU9CRZ9_9GAMM|nr:glycosyltransferase family 2 protein [Methylomarinovum caldicuralii]BCX80677.1 dolichol-phosphate hexosyltransferase [Methylomarinovum caldicuralii]
MPQSEAQKSGICPISVVLPAKNEAAALPDLIPRIRRVVPEAEIVVVDDGSDDGTGDIARSLGARVVRHPYSMGNGAAVKAGARAARGKILVFMDADGQHDPDDIPRLLEKFRQGFKMVVGARHPSSQASWLRRLANHFYNRLASAMTGHRIEDLTSGFRAADAAAFRKFLYLLPNGFSYPTTSTMAFLRAGFPVAYVPIHAGKRADNSRSHIRLLRDGLRFFVIILKIGALFSPMRLFLPVSGVIFLLGAGYYGYTFYMWHKLTNMSVILFLGSLFVFMMGIVSEQISSLHYRFHE